MDLSNKPLYTGPMFPLGSQAHPIESDKRLQGTIVGISTGHDGDTGATRVLTIQLTTAHAQAHELLHSNVEIIIRPKS